MKFFRISFVLAVLVMFSAALTAFAAQDDSILSNHIKEADGTSSQNTNSGSGIKTGHIQDGAVTTDKLADGSITTGKIADGAVTDAKITGTISASKVSTAGLNADLLDGMHAADFAGAVHSHGISEISGLAIALGEKASLVHNHAQSEITGLSDALADKADTAHDHDNIYQRKYANIVVVAKSGGDFTDPIAAVNSISNASAENPWLVKIMPGIYDLGSNPLYLRSYVDVEGSGQNNTVIKGAPPAQGNFSTLVYGANNVQISNLTMHNYGGVGAWVSHGIMAYVDSSFRVLNVTINIGGGVGHNEALRSTGGNFENLIMNIDSGPARWGYVFDYSGTNATIRNTVINGGAIDVRGSNLKMINVQMTNPWIINEYGPIRCLNVYDDNLTLVTCP